jgi:glucan phosphoethanolaminetransferase (alkaline phosphatase superfamily)
MLEEAGTACPSQTSRFHVAHLLTLLCYIFVLFVLCLVFSVISVSILPFLDCPFGFLNILFIMSNLYYLLFYGSRCYQILMSFSSIVWLWCFPYMEILVNFFSDLVQNRIDYVMVNVLASNSADRGFECHSSQSKYYQCCICCIVHIVGLVRKRCENPT